MNSTPACNNNLTVQLPARKTPPFTHGYLLRELFYRIFSNLSAPDLKNIELTNKYLSTRVKEFVYFNELKPIEDFIQESINIKKFARKRKLLVQLLREVKQKITPPDFLGIGVRTLIRYPLEVKSKLINIIKKIGKKTRDSMQPTDICKEIFELISIRGQIRQIKHSRSDEKWEACQKLCLELLVDNKINSLIFAVTSIFPNDKDKSERDVAFKDICVDLLKDQKISEARHVAEWLSLNLEQLL